MKALRPLAAPFVVPASEGVRVRTRLAVTPDEEQVLLAVGRYLGQLAGRDLSERCRRGTTDAGRTDRKRALTAASSSRWAGTITRTSDDQWRTARRSLDREARWLRSAIARISARSAAPCGAHGPAGIRGYATPAERYEKLRRLQILQARLREIERRSVAGKVSVCRGGRALARIRHNVDKAGISAGAWRDRWEAKRLFIVADGERDKRFGNETIRWDPKQMTLEIRLPTPLMGLANAPGARYRLERVSFPHRCEEVAAQAASGAIRYDITFDSERRRWYLDASWTFQRPTTSLEGLRQGGMLGVDLNADHLAAWAVDRYGNPVGNPVTVPLELVGLSSKQRDGHLRAAISELIAIACRRRLRAIAIEDIDFERKKSTSRETRERGGRGRRYRRMLHGLPVARFRSRLVQMASNAGLSVVAVDPAYTSRWGREHWHPPLRQERRQHVSTHHSAAVVIGRRGLGHGARRRRGVTERQQSHAAGRAALQARPRLLDREGTCVDGGRRVDPDAPSSRPQGTRAPTTVRGAPARHQRVPAGQERCGSGLSLRAASASARRVRRPRKLQSLTRVHRRGGGVDDRGGLENR